MLSVLAISLLVTSISCLNVKVNIKTDSTAAMEQGLKISMNCYFDLQDDSSEIYFRLITRQFRSTTRRACR